MTIDDRELIPAEAEFSDVIDRRDVTGQGHVEGRKGKGGFFVDLTTMDAPTECCRVFALPPPDLVAVGGELEQTLIEAGGSYNPRGTGDGLTLLFGARLIRVDQLVGVSVFDPNDLGFPGWNFYLINSTLIDGLVGLRYASPFAERWFVDGRGDLSAGDTKRTWSAWTGLGWTFGRERRHALLLGYRCLDMEFEATAEVVRQVHLEVIDRADVESAIRTSGPLAGVTFGF